MRRLLVASLLLFVMGCGKAENERCSDVICPGDGRGDCVDLTSDPQNCGECGLVCEDEQTCEDGYCQGCPAGEALCGRICADLEESERHCGACGEECATGESCADGTCRPEEECDGDDCPCTGEECDCQEDECACDAGRSLCGERCVDLTSDSRNCGTCGETCSSGLDCVDGECRCPAGMLDCWFGCTDVESDPLNCGGCGVLCQNSTHCEDGACRCPEGLSSCDGTCVDLESSRVHCGDCGSSCAETETCVNGTCSPSPIDDCVGVPLGVDMTRVAIYQAVEIELSRGGQPTPASARNADVVRGRDALVRVFLKPLAGFEGATLMARLSLEGSANEVLRSQPTLVAGASTPGDLGSTLNVFVPGASIQGDVDYAIEILACDGAALGSEGVVRVPETGAVPLLARRTGELSVKFFPFLHDGKLPDTSDEVLNTFALEVTRQYPTTNLTWELGEPILSDQSGILLDLGMTLDQLTEKREADAPPDNVYYYGVIDPAQTLPQYCDGGCTTGIAWWLPVVDDWSVAHRTGVGIGFGTYGANTFAHELGHNLGRDHAPCNAEGDIDYPYPNADIGVFGYDFVGGVLKAPGAFSDLMSYCEPNWVSDYNYQAILQRIAATQLSSVRGGPSDSQDKGKSLQTWASFVVSQGKAKWGKTRTKAGPPSPTPERGIVYDVDGLPLAEVEVHRMFMADAGGYKVFVPEQKPGWAAVGLADGLALPYP